MVCTAVLLYLYFIFYFSPLHHSFYSHVFFCHSIALLTMTVVGWWRSTSKVVMWLWFVYKSHATHSRLQASASTNLPHWQCSCWTVFHLFQLLTLCTFLPLCSTSHIQELQLLTTFLESVLLSLVIAIGSGARIPTPLRAPSQVCCLPLAAYEQG